MFDGIYDFNQPVDNFNTSSATSLYAMFQQTSFNQPVNRLSVEKVTEFGYLFASCRSVRHHNGAASMKHVYLLTPTPIGISINH